MADNIQDLIDFLGEQVLKVDLSALSGVEIVCGNPEHCIRLLQLIQDLTQLMTEEEDDLEGDMPMAKGQGMDPRMAGQLPPDAEDDYGDEMDDEDEKKLMQELEDM